MNFIHKIPKAYSKKSCDKLINWFEKNKKQAEHGITGNNLKLKSLEITLTLKDPKDYFGLGTTLIDSIQNFKDHYPYVDKHLCKWSLDPFMQLMKFKPNDYYDHIHCENDGTELFSKRVFAFMIFLNDIKKGGGTKFLFQKFIAKPKAGDFYIWPAHWTHLHQGVNAPKEKKYIITGWVKYS